MCISFMLQLSNDSGNQIVTILHDIRHTLNDSAPDSMDDIPVPFIFESISYVAMGLLTLSLGMVLLASTQALYLKRWLSRRTYNRETLHDAEEQARKRELHARSIERWVIANLIEFLPLLMQVAILIFLIGGLMLTYGFSYILAICLLCFAFLFVFLWHFTHHITLRDPNTPFTRTPFIHVVRTWRESRSSSHEVALDPEITHLGITNYLFQHISMTPNNSSILLQLFSLPVEHPRHRIKSLAPWTQLSSHLPSMLTEIYSKSRYNLLPALRLCLVVSGQGQSEQLQVNREAKRVYNTIKISNPLHNLYLHLLLAQLHASAGDMDHWQGVCRILKCLEYSEENTSELVWLVDSIQLYTLWIEEDFTTRIVEFLRGVVVYLAKCPSSEHDIPLLRTAIIIAAEWLMSRQRSDNGNPPLRYILSSQDVYSDEANQEMFVLVENQRLSRSESLQRTIKLYQDSQKTDSSSDFVIRTLLIPIIAIEGLAAEKNGENIAYAVPRIQSGDLRCSLEGLWDLWEGGFNQSDLFRFVLTLVVPPSSSVGDTQSSVVILLLKEYLQQINESPTLITEKAFRFIDATLEHPLTTGTTRDELELQLQDVHSPNPWLLLHIDNILRRRSTPCVADLEAVTTLDSRVKAIVSRKRLDLYLSSNAQPEPDILTLLVQAYDPAVSLEAFGQGVSLLESPLIGESDGQSPGSPRPFIFAQLEQEKRSHLISRFFDPQQSSSMCQSVWIMLTEDLYPRWELLPVDWRSDVAAALVAATEWMVKGRKILAKEIKKRKAKQLIGATVLALVNYSDMDHHRRRKIPLEARNERFQERLDACARVYLRLFASAIEDLGEKATPHTQHIVNFLADIPDVLHNEDAIKRIQHVLEI